MMNDNQYRQSANKYEKINPIKQIQIIENYRGYSKILFLRPFMDSYMGYLDGVFFGFTVPELSDKEKKDPEKRQKYQQLCLMEPKQAVDHYIDKIFFHAPDLEYETFNNNSLYRPFVTALKFKLEKS